MSYAGLPSARAEASRRNEAKSRGPKTAVGKARSSRNALTHGMRAEKHVVLPEEDTAQFEAFERALTEELAPEGALQAILAERIVAAAWRLKRADRMEGEVFHENALQDGSGSLGLSLIRDANRAGAFETLIRYRGSTLAEFWRSLRTLKALQAEPTMKQVAPQADGAAPKAPAPQPNEPESREHPGHPDRPEDIAREHCPTTACSPASASGERAALDVPPPNEPDDCRIPSGLAPLASRSAEPSQAASRSSASGSGSKPMPGRSGTSSRPPSGCRDASGQPPSLT
ncbi:MAG: hypothetical protein AAF637_17915 [Pseudomonadota bacterium]